MIRNLSPFARHLISCGFGALLMGGCGGGGGGTNANVAVENACLEACGAQVPMCTTVDVDSCNSTCGAYAVLIEENTACEAAFLAFEACKETATYTCAGNYAFIGGTECDATEAACDSSCESPCL